MGTGGAPAVAYEPCAEETYAKTSSTRAAVTSPRRSSGTARATKSTRDVPGGSDPPALRIEYAAMPLAIIATAFSPAGEGWRGGRGGPRRARIGCGHAGAAARAYLSAGRRRGGGSGGMVAMHPALRPAQGGGAAADPAAWLQCILPSGRRRAAAIRPAPRHEPSRFPLPQGRPPAPGLRGPRQSHSRSSQCRSPCMPPPSRSPAAGSGPLAPTARAAPEAIYPFREGAGRGGGGGACGGRRLHHPWSNTRPGRLAGGRGRMRGRRLQPRPEHRQHAEHGLFQADRLGVLARKKVERARPLQRPGPGAEYVSYAPVGRSERDEQRPRARTRTSARRRRRRACPASTSV